ncbi:RNA polymerase sigma factor [Ekhidna sp.]
MDEKELARQVLSGSDSAMRLLISKYERLVVHMIARVVSDDMDREELCQDVFVKIFDKLSTFKFDSKLSTWIATIAFRAALNFAKKKKIVQVDIDQIAFAIDDQKSITEEHDMKLFILKLVDQLPVNYKTVLTLFYLEGFSYPEIVDVTGMPEGTVKNYIHRARLKLKKIVEEQAIKEVALLP